MMQRLRYCYRITMKIISFALFGIGSLIVGLLVLPLLRIFCFSQERFSRAARKVISRSMRLFLLFMRLVRIVLVQKDPSEFSSLSGCIIAPNHPSLLDVVILFSLIENSTCIVNASLTRGVTRFIVNALYIKNSASLDEIIADSTRALKEGLNVIIFPEGTRTKDEKHLVLRRGLSCIAIKSGAPIIPVHILGNEKRGLKKHDSLFLFNRTEPYRYRITVGTPLVPPPYHPDMYREDSMALTQTLSDTLQSPLR